MKKVIVFFMFVMLAVVSNAQSQTVNVPVDQLTPTQLLKIQSDAKIAELEKKLQTYGNWVGVGGEIGTAVKEGLSAVVDVADKFGKTDVGKFTMIMIAYKVMGKDFIRIIIGLLFFLVFSTFLFIYHKRHFTVRRIAIEDNGWKFWLPKKYQIIEPKRYEGYEFVKWANIAMLLGSFGITYAIMFG